jgi:acyl carrier protein
MLEIKEKVRELIADIIEVEIEEIQDETRFVEDLGADSLKALELLALLEKEYKIKIPESNLKKLTTLNFTMSVLLENSKTRQPVMEA